jgi:hypothetical protein
MVADVEVGHGFLAHWSEVWQLRVGWSTRIKVQDEQGKLLGFGEVDHVLELGFPRFFLGEFPSTQDCSQQQRSDTSARELRRTCPPRNFRQCPCREEQLICRTPIPSPHLALTTIVTIRSRPKLFMSAERHEVLLELAITLCFSPTGSIFADAPAAF